MPSPIVSLACKAAGQCFATPDGAFDRRDEWLSFLEVGAKMSLRSPASAAASRHLLTAIQPGFLHPVAHETFAGSSSAAGRPFGLPVHAVHEAPVLLSVIIACSVSIGVIAALWTAYYFWSRYRQEAPRAFIAMNCISFAICSWCMNLLNKSLTQMIKEVCFVTGAQMAITALAVTCFGWRRLTGSWREVLRWMFVPALFFGMLMSSMFTFRHITLSLLMVIRNLSPLVVLPLERALMPADQQPIVTMPMLLALLVLLGSSVVYCLPIHVSSLGFCLALLNMCLAVCDRLSQRRLLANECKGLSTETCVLLNNIFAIVPTIILGLSLGEASTFNASVWFSRDGTVLLLLSSVMGAGICYFAIAIQRDISATSFMVQQNAGRMLVILAGVAMFNDPFKWPFQALGAGGSFVGVIWYGKLQNDKFEKPAESAFEDSACDAAMEDTQSHGFGGDDEKLSCSGQKGT